ncbi:MAG: M23 family metallopeptidase [Dermatophilaceae bacterium]
MSERRAFPLAGLDWNAFREDPILRGADDGPPGRGGWHHRRGDLHVHRGIDLKAPIGSPLVAIENGVADFRDCRFSPGRSGRNTAGHRVRLLGQSGAMYLYCHLGTDSDDPGDAFPAGIRPGDLLAVQAGQVLGQLGHTGGSLASGCAIPPQAAHLHFQFHPNGLEALDVNPVRLFERIASVSARSTVIHPIRRRRPSGRGPFAASVKALDAAAKATPTAGA